MFRDYKKYHDSTFIIVFSNKEKKFINMNIRYFKKNFSINTYEYSCNISHIKEILKISESIVNLHSLEEKKYFNFNKEQLERIIILNQRSRTVSFDYKNKNPSDENIFVQNILSSKKNSIKINDSKNNESKENLLYVISFAVYPIYYYGYDDMFYREIKHALSEYHNTILKQIDNIKMIVLPPLDEIQMEQFKKEHILFKNERQEILKTKFSKYRVYSQKTLPMTNEPLSVMHINENMFKKNNFNIFLDTSLQKRKSYREKKSFLYFMKGNGEIDLYISNNAISKIGEENKAIKFFIGAYFNDPDVAIFIHHSKDLLDKLSTILEPLIIRTPYKNVNELINKNVIVFDKLDKLFNFKWEKY